MKINKLFSLILILLLSSCCFKRNCPPYPLMISDIASNAYNIAKSYYKTNLALPTITVWVDNIDKIHTVCGPNHLSCIDKEKSVIWISDTLSKWEMCPELVHAFGLFYTPHSSNDAIFTDIYTKKMCPQPPCKMRIQK